jgi:Carboxypeptidase regulatory-like domain
MRDAALVAILCLAAASVGGAQSVSGVILTVDKAPVAGARLFLLAPSGLPVDTGRTNERGGFHMRSDSAGRYSIAIRRLGWAPEQTLPFTLDTGQARRDTLVVAFRQLLRPVDVVVRDEVHRLAGIDVRQLGRRYISPAQVDSVRFFSRTLAEFIHRAGAPGVLIENEGRDNVCYRTRVLGDAKNRNLECAEVYVDGLRVAANVELSPLDIESIVLLRPLEASTIYGSPGGAVLIFTRRAISRANR